MIRFSSSPALRFAQARAPIKPEIGSLSQFLDVKEFNSNLQALSQRA
jgi:hypothetical protein